MGQLIDDFARAARGGRALQADIVRTIGELALARVYHLITPIRRLPLGKNTRPTAAEPTELSADQHDLLRRVTYVLPRMARRVPWRSDCLVQALAARRWLASVGIQGKIRLGARGGAQAGFEAHAWFTVGDAVVTGWDIEGFGDFAAFPLDHRDA